MGRRVPGGDGRGSGAQSVTFAPTRRAVLAGGAAVLVARPARAAVVTPTAHYELDFIDKARRQSVALFQVDIDGEGKRGASGPVSAAKTPEKIQDIESQLGIVDAAARAKLYVDEARYKAHKFVWDRRDFGPNAFFEIERKSSPHYADGKPDKSCPDDCNKKGGAAKTALWLPTEWTLKVKRASFPGNEQREFTLTIVFKREKPEAEWFVSATMPDWWSPSGRSISTENSLEKPRRHLLKLEDFLNDNLTENKPLVFWIDSGRNAFLARLFGDRVETEASFKLELDQKLRWKINSITGKQFFILDLAFEFGSIFLSRVRNDQRGAKQTEQDGAADKTTYLFDNEAIYGRKATGKPEAIDGLYGEIASIAGFAVPAAKVAKGKERRGGAPRGWSFEFANAAFPGATMAASVTIDQAAVYLPPAETPPGTTPPAKTPAGESSLVTLKAAVRHWGHPELTVAGCATETKNRMRGIGRLTFANTEKAVATAEGPFEFSGFEIVRQQQAGKVVTRLRADPCAKESTVSLRLGDIGVAALPPISVAPGAAPHSPMIVVEASEPIGASDKNTRKLSGFVARLALVSAGVALPKRLATEDGGAVSKPIPGDHVTRLQFAEADVQFYIPALGPVPVSSADAVIPLGPAMKDVVANFDLARATLSVLRPGDLLSLKFRFAGLQLRTPWPPASDQPASLLPLGGRSTARPYAQHVVGRGAPRDDRPLLVVEFPPQHVVERAYARQITVSPDLPELESATQAATVALLKASLREPKAWTTSVLDDNSKSDGWGAAAIEALMARLFPATEQRLGSSRGSRETWRKGLQSVCGWPDDGPLFLNSTSKSPKTRKDFDEAFRAQTAKLPQEQQLYVGADFLDPDARRIALSILRKLKEEDDGKKAEKPWPSVVLPATEWTDLFKPLIEAKVMTVVPVQTNSTTGRSIWPDVAAVNAGYDKSQIARELYLKTLVEIERARDRRDRDYAAFSAVFRKEAISSNIGAVGEDRIYFGGAWFDELKAASDTKPGAPKLPTEFVEALKAGLALLDQEKYDKVVPARLSGPSRIAFRIDGDDHEADRLGGRIPFTLEGLTNWGAMDMAVVRRAERLMEPLQGTRLPPRWGRRALNDEAAILRFQGLTSSERWDWQPRAARQSAAKHAVTPAQRLAEVYAASSQAPDLFQTAIELPFRLFLSPAQDATWITPAPRVRRGAGFHNDDIGLFRELWTARLGGSDNSAGVRAVWSPDFRPEAFLPNAPVGAPPLGPHAPWSLPRRFGSRYAPDGGIDIDQFRTGLEPFDRHELVALTSVYGLPVLGRRSPNGGLAIDSDQIEPPPGFLLQDLELHKDGKRETDLSAIYRPKPIAVNELSLSALGGNLDIDGSFQPPAAARDRQSRNLFDALSIERWRQRTVLGRDILVEVVYKGFLFPIGHRASLVKLTERRFEQVEGRDSPLAVLTQRLFLRISKPEKRFMAEGQPNSGVRWPCERIVMLTRQSPDLVDARSYSPMDKPTRGVLPRGRIELPGKAGFCLWPRTSARPGSEVWFEMQIGDEPTPVRMPLIFVDNVAANDKETMQALVEYYMGADKDSVANVSNAANTSPTRRLQRNSQPVVMAPEYKPGDTTFETDWWLVGAEGREQTPPVVGGDSTKIDNTKFIRDAFMEGQDQPPFYPIVEKARCRLKAVERFTGSGPLWADVTFDGEYVARGFSDQATDGKAKGDRGSEIYLRILKSGDGKEDTLPLDFKDRVDLAGGVASPQMAVVAYSRQLGPINGGPETPKPLDRATNSGDAQFKADRPADQISSAILPTLERIERFKDSINIVPKGKFLGIMPLSDMIEKVLGVKLHPKLNEVMEYGAASAAGVSADSAAEVRSLLVKTLIAPAQTVVEEVEAAWIRIASERLKLNLGQDTQNLAKVYPQVGRDIEALKTLLQKAQNPETSNATFFAELAAIHEAARRLGRTIDNIARDPLAAATGAQLELYTAVNAEIQDFVKPVSEIAKIADDGKKLKGILENEIKAAAILQLITLIGPSFAERAETVRKEVERLLDPAVTATLSLDAERLRQAPLHLANTLKVIVEDKSVEVPPSPEAREILAALELRLRTAQTAIDSGLKGRDPFLSGAEVILPRPLAIALVALARLQETRAFAMGPLGVKDVGNVLINLAPVLEQLTALVLSSQIGERITTVANFCTDAKAALAEMIKTMLPSMDNLPVDADCLDGRDVKMPAACKTSKLVGPIYKIVEDALDACWKINIRRDAQAIIEKAAVELARAMSAFARARATVDEALARFAGPGCTLPTADLLTALNDVAAQQGLVLARLRHLADETKTLLQDEFSRAAISQMNAAEALQISAIDAVKKLLQGTLRYLGQHKLLPSFEDNAFNNISAKIEALATAVTAVLPETAAELKRLASELQKAPSTLKSVNDILEKAINAVTLADGAVGEADVQKIDAAITAYQAFIKKWRGDIEAAFTGALYNLLADAAASALAPQSAKFAAEAKSVIVNISDGYERLIEQRKKLEAYIARDTPVVASLLDRLAIDADAGTDRKTLLKVAGKDSAGKAIELLDAERELARSGEAWPSPSAVKAVAELARMWGAPRTSPSSSSPALLVLSRRFELLASNFVRVLVVEALDLRPLRQELDRIVRELVPTRAILSYALDTPVRNFGLPGVGDIFLPVKGTRLDIQMNAVVDLAAPSSPQARVSGRMGPFGINLFGNFDVVLLNFHGLEFRSGSGRPSGFDVRFGDFVIGSKAKFLKQLEPYVSPKCGLPPVRMMRDKPGIEATYGVNLGSFGVGALSFSNVSLNAGARLPFGAKEEAEFIISIGRSDAPFLISSTVFGGGGYLALLANGKGFIGLETSFDYGGVFTFGFGPLLGTGQITLGLYFRAVRGESARLGMNFMARGAANIACFSFSASLFVRLTYVDGKMDGRATYTFSFSLYLDDIDFTFEVYVNQGSSAGQSQPTAFMDLPGAPSLTRFAGAQSDPLDAFALAGGPSPARDTEIHAAVPQLRVQTPSPKKNWTVYHALFDDTIDVLVGV